MKLEVLIEILTLLPIIYGVYLFIYAHKKARKNSNFPIPKNEPHNYAILIPARNESKVIEDLLKSIEIQTEKIDMKDVYVIVEDKLDPTVGITKRHNANIVVRKHLNLKTKGYALDEAIKEILSKKHKYSAYFIFDADNVLDKDFIKNMSETFDKGYDIGLGYRNCKNIDLNVVSVCSCLTFSMVNTLSNESKKNTTNTITLSGTGFYIRGSIINEIGAYPFNSLTEDYELTLYANLNDLTSYYNEKAVSYDEQPTDIKTTIKQRTRWIKGYFTCRKKYIKKIKEKAKLKDKNYGSHILEIIGIKPFVHIIIGIILFFITQLISIFKSSKTFVIPLMNIVSILLVAYIIMVIITMLMLILERDKLSLTPKLAVKVMLYNPIYLSMYVYCAIEALIKKDLTWQRIDHKINK